MRIEDQRSRGQAAFVLAGDPRGRTTACRSHVRGLPRPALAEGRISRKSGRCPPALGDRDKESTFEARDRRCRLAELQDLPSAERIGRAACGRQFRRDVAALPGDQDSVGLEQRKGQLDELVEGGHGARCDRGPGFAGPLVASDGFGPSSGDLNPAGESGSDGGGREEVGLLGDRFDEECPLGGECHRQRQGGIAAAAADVDEAADPALAERPDGGQRIEDVADGNRGGIPNRREVDGGRPREEEAGVALDRGERGWVEVEAQLGQPTEDGSIVFGRKVRKCVDVRRKRFSPAVQVRLLSARPAVRPEEPLPASSFIAPEAWRRSFAIRPVRSRVSPNPSRIAVPRVASVRMPDVTRARNWCQRGYPRIGTTELDWWKSESSRTGA
jgi:hypothetical protein